jgi:hypothetical protein
MSTMTLTPTMARPAVTTSTVRLTRRGRLVVFAAGLLAVLVLGLVWGAGSVATERPGTPEPSRVVQVQPGDTLYALAAQATTDGDVNAMVERIQDVNALDTSVLQVGQKLRIPVS